MEEDGVLTPVEHHVGRHQAEVLRERGGGGPATRALLDMQVRDTLLTHRSSLVCGLAHLLGNPNLIGTGGVRASGTHIHGGYVDSGIEVREDSFWGARFSDDGLKNSTSTSSCRSTPLTIHSMAHSNKATLSDFGNDTLSKSLGVRHRYFVLLKEVDMEMVLKGRIVSEALVIVGVRVNLCEGRVSREVSRSSTWIVGRSSTCRNEEGEEGYFHSFNGQIFQ